MSHLVKSLIIMFQTYPTGSHLDVKGNRNMLVTRAISAAISTCCLFLQPQDLPSAGHQEPTQQTTALGLFQVHSYLFPLPVC